MSEIPAPFFSIIVPVYNGASYLNECLGAINNSAFSDWELIVVDDGSTDISADIAHSHRAIVIQTNRQSGPAKARNLGAAAANGRYLFFTDADCKIQPVALTKLAQFLQDNETITAVIGSYDDDPAAPNFASQYKNLFHHFTHQSGGDYVQTFWTGCGAIKREAFISIGGFVVERYPNASIEDIELGYRLTAKQKKIALVKDIQVKHLKRWTLTSMVRSDIVDRAIPWSRLLQSKKGTYSDLNVQRSQQLSILLVFLLPVFLLINSWLWLLPVVGLLGINYPLYLFFLRRKGLLFTCRALIMHWLYFAYSGFSFLIALISKETQN